MGVTGSVWEHSSVLQPCHFLSVTLGSNVMSLSKPNCSKIKAKGAEENPYPDKNYWLELDFHFPRIMSLSQTSDEDMTHAGAILIST